MLWKQQEIGAHTGVGEETPPSPPKKTKTKTKTKKNATHVTRLQTSS